MIIPGKETKIKSGYFIFLLTILIGFGNGIASIITLIHGGPPSVIISLVNISNNVVICIAIFGPILALGILMKKEPSSALSRLFWVVMIIGVSLCLIVIVRGITWLFLGTTSLRTDLKTFIYLREKKNELPTPTTVYMSREHKCCGIESFNDWEEIYLEVDSVKQDDKERKDRKEIRPRKLPDFCCSKNATKGCGTRYIKEMFDAMEHIVSNCEDEDKDRNERCKNAEKALLPYVENKKLEDLPQEVNDVPGKDDTKSKFVLLYITDSRIDAAVDKGSLLEQKRIADMCNTLKQPESFESQVMIYYKGFMRSDNVTFGNGYVTKRFIPCSPQRVEDEKNKDPKLCVDKLNAINYFVHVFGFCNWLNFQTTGDTRFTLEERIELAKKDGKVYYNGCENHLRKYIDNFVITVVLFCSILLVLFCLLMHTYHRYYFAFVSPQLLECPMPRWYEPLPNEISPMHSFGDVDFIADGNCTKLPPLPCHLKEELELEDELGEEQDPKLTAAIAEYEESDDHLLL